MCGRYYIDQEAWKELETIVGLAEQRIGENRDIHPSDLAFEGQRGRAAPPQDTEAAEECGKVSAAEVVLISCPLYTEVMLLCSQTVRGNH